MRIKRISQADWERSSQALKSCSLLTLEIAYSVLVEGKKVIQVSEERNVTRQNTYAAVKRVTNILDKQNVEGLQLVSVWVPSDTAEEIYKIAEPYMNEKEKNR
ncbi:TrfB-related DNA-binding protein [Photorhabdus sp. RM71S]|uniref:TrfB-related DNA-binding protein n=1 Tax=Photorhabdus sp. RM71S TaxID=3342824 RepID=UPI0036D9F6BA